MRKELRELRNKSGLTQMEVAERLRVDQTTVSKWENGEALPRTEMLFLIASLFGVKVDEIKLKRVSKTKNRESMENGRERIETDIGEQGTVVGFRDESFT
jgi:putative transcriptional regulator